MHKGKKKYYNILIGNLKNILPEKLWRRWKDNMKMNVKEKACENTGKTLHSLGRIQYEYWDKPSHNMG
jgi:hypothetical protein